MKKQPSEKTIEEEFDILSKKYDLPQYHELNEEFEIEKIDRKSKTLLRLIRKVMMEKIVNSMQFLEFLVNPINSPRAYLPYIKLISAEDKKDMDKTYFAFAALSMSSIGLEIDYSEKNEAQMINEISKVWGNQKKVLRNFLNKLNDDNSLATTKKERSYFG